MTDKLRAAAQQAMEALEQDNPAGRTGTIKALSTALAEPPRIPDWISYAPAADVLTIHGRRYSAKLFDGRGFGSPPGTLLRIVDGSIDVVTVEKVAEHAQLINPPACTWTHDDDEGSWDAECGERWSITEGTPEENNFRFCPGCGRTVKTIFVTPRK
jgi:hypothetical protein